LTTHTTPNGRTTVLVDMDGTLADVRHRLRFLQGRRKDWKGFFSQMHKDPPNPEIVQMVRELARDHEIVIVSGRPDNYRRVTEDWLASNHVPYASMYMRRAGDHRPDDIVKREILENLLKLGKDIKLVIDDRPTVCDMWRGCGLDVHQVPSDFWEREELGRKYAE